MTADEKIKFLKKMGYGGSIIRAVKGLPEEPKHEIKKGCASTVRIDKQDLLLTCRIFGIR